MPAKQLVRLSSALIMLLGLTGKGLAVEPQNTPPTPQWSVALYVSPHGRDSFSGRLSEVNAPKNDGPLATLEAARDRIRGLKFGGRLNGAAVVYLRAGRYQLDQPLAFGPDDSGSITYASFPGEQAIIDGGRAITTWQTTKVHDRDAWVADLPEVKAGRWNFHELFVDGQRRPRARFPKTGTYQIASIPSEFNLGTGGMGPIGNVFVVQPDQIQSDWKNFSDIDLVLLHYWVEERSPIGAFDPAKNMVTLSRVPTQPLWESGKGTRARFFLENVFEALTEPGEWYLDRPAGKLYYLPKPGEDPAHTLVQAPRLTQLLRLVGKPEDQHFVESLHFDNLTFATTDWTQPDFPATHWNRPDLTTTTHGQGAADIAGSIYLAGTRFCSIENCTFTRLGGYAVELADGSTSNRIVGNEMTDLAGGGVKMGGATPTGLVANRTGSNRITDNHIYAIGRIFSSACGILAMNTSSNTISHNHIHDLYYTGISCGWVWGYGESIARDNHIEKNHIHDLGQGLLNDMGGIYTLGVQPGTTIRGNLIHDIDAPVYGAWCIYPDEGSSHLLIENNVCYNTNRQIFSEHYGRENIVRNNIFAFGAEGIVNLGRKENHNSFTMERNILITEGKPLFAGGWAHKLSEPAYESDLNLLWDTAGTPVVAQNYHDPHPISLEQWRDIGRDRHSILADPHAKSLAARNFSLASDSPALSLGFQPIDISDVGPRPVEKRD